MKPPRFVKAHIAIATIFPVACVVIGLWPILSQIWPHWIAGEFIVDDSFDWWWFVRGAFGAVPLLLLRRRSPRAPAFTLLFELIVLGELAQLTPPSPFGSLDRVLGLAQGSWLVEVLALLNLTQYTVWFFLVALTLATLLGRAWLFGKDVRSWFSASVFWDKGFAPRPHSRARLVRLIGIAAIVYLWGPILAGIAFWEIFNGLADLTGLDWFTNIFDSIELVAGLLPTFFLLSCGVLLWAYTERLIVDEHGVRLYLFRPRYSMFFAPWLKISSFDLVTHGKRLPSVIIHYRSRFRLPFTLGADARRYEAGTAVTDAVLTASEAQRGFTT